MHILNAAIGTIFAFLLISLVVSALNEYILSLLDRRAHFLRMGLAELFGQKFQAKGFFEKWFSRKESSAEQQTDDGRYLGPEGERLLSHGLLNAFSRSDNGGTSPSYIPAGAFVTGLLDIVLEKAACPASADLAERLKVLGKENPGVDALSRVLGEFLGSQALPPGGAAIIPGGLYQRVAEALAMSQPLAARSAARDAVEGAPDFAAAQEAIRSQPPQLQPLMSLLATQAHGDLATFKASLADFGSKEPADVGSLLMSLDQALALPEITPARLSKAIAMLDNEKLREALLSLFRATGGDLAGFKKAVEGWFNGVMDRTSGWYKRYAQKWMIGLGLVLAVVFNVDTINILRVLSNNPQLAAAVSDHADVYLGNGPPLTAVEREKRLADSIAAVEAAKTALNAAGDAEKTGQLATDLAEAQAKVDTLNAYQVAVKRLYESGLPIGWTSQVQEKLAVPAKGTSPEVGIRQFRWLVLLEMIAGWGLTAMAASLGAPFWFDLLGRFVNVRAAGRAPGEKEPASTPTKPPPATLDTTPSAPATPPK